MWLRIAARVEEHTVTADRANQWDARIDELLAEVLDLADAGPHVVVGGHHLADALRQRLHIATGHAAVGVEALEGDEERPCLPGEFGIPKCKEAADVDEVVLLGRHRGAIRIGRDLAHDLGDRPIGVARLSLLDEVGVLEGAGGVEHHEDVIGVAVLVDLAEVRHRGRLSACHVHVGLE